MTISGNGDLIATLNKVECSTKDSLFSLFKIKPQTGQLTRIASSRVEGALSKDIQFDVLVCALLLWLWLLALGKIRRY